MEGVELRTGDQSGLIGDPEVANTVKGIGENDSTVTQANLKDGAVFLGHFHCINRMIVAQLSEVAKDRNAGHFGKTFDFGDIRAIDDLDHSIYDSNEEEGEDLRGEEHPRDALGLLGLCHAGLLDGRMYR
jgi:hypothetical protein